MKDRGRSGGDSRDSAPTLIRGPHGERPTLVEGEHAAGIDQPPALPEPPVVKPKPIRKITAVSMKTPDGIVDQLELPQRDVPLPAVRIRAMSEVGMRTPARGVGRLAPPRDEHHGSRRRAREWTKVTVGVLLVAAIVSLGIVLLSRAL